METVTSRTYFHINSAANKSCYPLMTPGSVLQVGASTNPYFNFYETQYRTYDVMENGRLVPVGGLTWLKRVQAGTIIPHNSGIVINIAVDVGKHFHMLARELLWENIRLAEFSEAPSRQRCLFLLESLADVQRWLPLLTFRPAQVVEVRATGRALRVDQTELPADSEPLPFLYQRARRYWAGTLAMQPLTEVLFEGSIEVVRVVSTIS